MLLINRCSQSILYMTYRATCILSFFFRLIYYSGNTLLMHISIGFGTSRGLLNITSQTSSTIEVTKSTEKVAKLLNRTINAFIPQFLTLKIRYNTSTSQSIDRKC